MKHFRTSTQGPALTRRHVFTAFGVAMVSATVLASPLEALEGGRESTNSRGAAKAAKQATAPFVLSF